MTAEIALNLDILEIMSELTLESGFVWEEIREILDKASRRRKRPIKFGSRNDPLRHLYNIDEPPWL
ncbi:hypothetical protein ACEUZ9_002794 [Paracoccus litorisediminis]|uniref:hypothetical protein n=1 Tax=Paracoccus litorisediminis TaxID=2006130 RepID=UPI0037313B2A